MFGYVIKNAEDDYTINVDLEAYGSGYNVVPKDIDPYNQYDLEEVKAYCNANPQMLLSEHPLSNKKDLVLERRVLRKYLSDTDYMAIKCAEKGLSMATEYPDEYEGRQQARDRINEINEILGGR